MLVASVSGFGLSVACLLQCPKSHSEVLNPVITLSPKVPACLLEFRTMRIKPLSRRTLGRLQIQGEECCDTPRRK